MRKTLALFAIVFPISCAQAQTPREVYEEYRGREIAGLAFDGQSPYFSKRKWAEVEESLDEAVRQNNKSRAELMAFFSKFSQRIEKCMSITLLEETVTGNRAAVIYAQEDNCNKDPDVTVAPTRIVTMVDEDGWKIDEIEMTF